MLGRIQLLRKRYWGTIKVEFALDNLKVKY